MSGRHTWAVIERRFNWLALRAEIRILSTHKTRVAAVGRTPNAVARHCDVLRAKRVAAVPRIGQWWNGVMA